MRKLKTLIQNYDPDRDVVDWGREAMGVAGMLNSHYIVII